MAYQESPTYQESPIDYFTENPWACKCGCGFDNINPTFVHALNAARHRAGVSFVINSACRCISHNMDEGGQPNSDHLTGEGVDIAAPIGRMRYLIVEALVSVGITRIGIGKTFVHAGARHGNPANVMWVYY